MKKYDMVVVGTGSGLGVVDEAVGHGLKVAVVDKGPVGGTCLNNGCIPSKMLIYAADRIVEAQEATVLGTQTRVTGIDFNFIMERMRKSVGETADQIKDNLQRSRNPRFYAGEGYFINESTMEVGGEKISAETFILASGTRPSIPPLKGIEDVDYLTNITLLDLKEKPESLLIIGGGYIGVEYGHFFAAMGTKVTIVEMADRLVLAEEPSVSEVLKKKLTERMTIYTGVRVEEVKKDTATGYPVVVVADQVGQQHELSAQKLLLAAGRRSNADSLKVENAGIELDNRGFIKVNEFMQTNRPNIYAIGDANGLQMFTHAANRQAGIVASNILHKDNYKIDLSATPHAVYSHPQIAAVGMTEAQAREKHNILVGIASYLDVAKGDAMREVDGFAKAIVDKETKKILGFHIIGPQAPELIQEVTNAMALGGNINILASGMRIHPALNELVMSAFSRLEEM